MNHMQDYRHLEDNYNRVREERNILTRRLKSAVSMDGCNRMHASVAVTVFSSTRTEGKFSLAGKGTLTFGAEVPMFEVDILFMRNNHDGSIFPAFPRQETTSDGVKAKECRMCGTPIGLTEDKLKMSNPFKDYLVSCFLTVQAEEQES